MHLSEDFDTIHESSKLKPPCIHCSEDYDSILNVQVYKLNTVCINRCED